MQNFIETLAALLTGAGLFLLGWMLAGRLLTPVGADGPAFAVLPASGDGARLERDVKGLLWLQGSGLTRLTVVIADCGLNEEGRAIALLLQRREPGVVLCSPGQLEQLMSGGAAQEAL